MTDIKYEKVNEILKHKIKSLQEDYNKLKAVDSMLGKDATESKKLDLCSSIFVLQDVQSEIIDLAFTDI